MRQEVQVVRVEADRARVQGVRASACDGCAGRASCGTLGSWSQRLVEMDMSNTVGARVGDLVAIELPERYLLKMMFYLYGLPLLAFVCTGLLARGLAGYMHFQAPDLWAALAGACALGGTYACLRWLFRRHPPEFSGHMVELVRKAASGTVGQPVDLQPSVKHD